LSMFPMNTFLYSLRGFDMIYYVSLHQQQL
jgi:hypothetical protein